MFGIDEDSLDDLNEADNANKTGHDAPSKAFYLLNALSDLMMLPFEMLADRTMRKEVNIAKTSTIRWFFRFLFADIDYIS